MEQKPRALGALSESAFSRTGNRGEQKKLSPNWIAPGTRGDEEPCISGVGLTDS